MKLSEVNMNSCNMALIPPKQVYEWVKTGKWSQAQFVEWWYAVSKSY